VHLVLAVAVQRGWPIEHYPLENCSKAEHSALERQRTQELACIMNDRDSWRIEDFDELAEELA
jgi:hypothetical protein